MNLAQLAVPCDEIGRTQSACCMGVECTARVKGIGDDGNDDNDDDWRGCRGRHLSQCNSSSE